MEQGPIDVTPAAAPARRSDRRRVAVVAVAAVAVVTAAVGAAVAAGSPSHRPAARSALAATDLTSSDAGDASPTPATPPPSSTPSDPTTPAAPTTDDAPSGTATGTTSPTSAGTPVRVDPGGVMVGPTGTHATAGATATPTGPKQYPINGSQDFTVTITGPTTVQAGEPVTYVLHWTWSASPPQSTDLCFVDDDHHCGGGPLPCTDGDATTTTPPPSEQPGSAERSYTETFDKPETVTLRGRADSNCSTYYVGDAETELQVTVQ